MLEPIRIDDIFLADSASSSAQIHSVSFGSSIAPAHSSFAIRFNRKSPDCPFLRASNDINDPSKLARISPQGVVWFYPLLRASTEHRP